MFVTLPEVEFNRYDVIIAGSGPAGCTLALQLEKTGKSVLLVETGGAEFDDDVQSTFTAMDASGHFGADYWPNHWLRSFGGTSGVWAGWCAPLSARNMVDWPIARSDLDGYYRTAATLLERSPDFLDYTQDYTGGFAYRPFSIVYPTRFGEAYLEPFRASTGVHVLLETSLSRLRANEGRTAVAGFDLVALSGDTRTVNMRAGQALALAAGGLGNAQILLGEAGDNAPGIGNETDQVGRYLMEHPHFYDCARLVVRSDLALPQLPDSYGEFAPTLVPQDEIYQRMGGLDISLELEEDDLNTADHVERYLAETLGSVQVFLINVRSEMAPEAANRVRRVPGAQGPAGLPRLTASCVISSDALRAVDGYLRQLGAAMAESGQGRVRLDNQTIFHEATGGGHIMGTTRMGDDPRRSVVDAECRVHGYSNLYVAGSSVFSTGGYANPTLTIVALAARLGDHLGRQT